MEQVNLPMSRCARNALLVKHQSLVKVVARRMVVRLPANIELDDLMQAGMLGLNQAITNFSEEHGASFDTYAYRRVHGAMIDELREGDHLARSVRSKLRKVAAAVHQLEHKLGRPPRAIETAKALDWSLQDLHDVLVEAGSPGLRMGDDPDLDAAENEASLVIEAEAQTHFGADAMADPFLGLQRRQELAAVNRAFETLSEREQMMMRMLYDEDQSQEAVADFFGVSPSRVCQLHREAVDKLRLRVGAVPDKGGARPRVEAAAALPVETPAATASRAAKGSTNGGAWDGSAGDWLDQAAEACLL